MKRVIAWIMIILSIAFPALGEKHEEAWIMCQPDSEVVVRARPNKHAAEVARVFPGDHIVLYGDHVGRWYHCSLVCETGEGWVRSDHLSFTEPEVFPEGKVFVTNRKKVRTRLSIRGNYRKKLKKGTRVTVYLMANEWSVTSQGYIMTKFLEEPDEAEVLELQVGQEMR